jgi:hypothetical protein
LNCTTQDEFKYALRTTTEYIVTLENETAMLQRHEEGQVHSVSLLVRCCNVR